MNKKIEFSLCALKAQRPTDVEYSFIELFDNHLEYNVRFTAEEFTDPEDEKLGMRDTFNSVNAMLFRKAISGLEICIMEDGNWKVQIISPDAEVKLFFEEEKEAIKIHNQIKAWMLKV